MVINVLWQVISRYLLKSPSPFTDELARYLLIWVGLLGAAFASGKKLHVAIDLTSSRLSASGKRKLRNAINITVILFVIGGLLVGGGNLIYITFILGQTSPALQIPLATVYLVLPLSGLFIIYYKLDDIFRDVK